MKSFYKSFKRFIKKLYGPVNMQYVEYRLKQIFGIPQKEDEMRHLEIDK